MCWEWKYVEIEGSECWVCLKRHISILYLSDSLWKFASQLKYLGTKLSEEMCAKTPEEKKNMSNIPYSSALGSLMYAMLFTRPDLCHR
jgi:hypothetical protein